MSEPLLIAVMGPTASGKTPLAELLSERLDAQLINCDAFQIYRGLDVGTAKPERRELYELLDIRDPSESFGVGEWVRLASNILDSLYAAKRHVIVVGGTGLYVRALFEQYSGMHNPPDLELRREIDNRPIEGVREELIERFPDLADKIDLKNPARVRRALEKASSLRSEAIVLPPFKKLKLGLLIAANVLEDRLQNRFDEMVQNGWREEIESLREQGLHREDSGFRAIGYRPLWDHLDGKISFEEARETTITQTRQYAKRQRTWLRSEPSLTPLSADSFADLEALALEQVELALK